MRCSTIRHLKSLYEPISPPLVSVAFKAKKVPEQVPEQVACPKMSPNFAKTTNIGIKF